MLHNTEWKDTLDYNNADARIRPYIISARASSTEVLVSPARPRYIMEGLGITDYISRGAPCG